MSSMKITSLWDGIVVSVYTPHAVGHGFAPRPDYTKDHYGNGTN